MNKKKWDFTMWAVLFVC